MKSIFLTFFSIGLLIACNSEKSTNETSSNQSDLEAPTESTEEIDQFTFEGCFQLEEEMEDSKTVTFIILEIEGTDVFGEEAVEMSGHEYNAVAAGSFEGTYKDGIINIIYEFDIDGDTQKEEQEFKLTEEGLLMTKSALRKKDDVLMLMQKGLFNTLIPKIDCP
ncbi:MAG: hypothetical protein AAFZ15_04935 [Bacteroidota bacterium]